MCPKLPHREQLLNHVAATIRHLAGTSHHADSVITTRTGVTFRRGNETVTLPVLERVGMKKTQLTRKELQRSEWLS